MLIAPAMLAGQLSVGWSNDAFDAGRDAAAGRTDKPHRHGPVSARRVWIAAFTALVAALAMSLAISAATALINAVIIGAGVGLQRRPEGDAGVGPDVHASGSARYPRIATSTLPGHPLPHWWVTAAAATVGLGAHFANVLPDLAADRVTGVKRTAAAGRRPLGAARGGAGWSRSALLLSASRRSLLLACQPAAGGSRWPALAVAAVLAVVGARGSGRMPFFAAIGIAARRRALVRRGVASR